jgi:hypothetical protein
METFDCSKVVLAGLGWALLELGRIAEMGRPAGIVTNF